ncbi:hypothetical protein J8J20_21955, partial [Mycobacterium tuberculosis]|nr:hypothetical protein [Mycobacterium tuberculosis]
ELVAQGFIARFTENCAALQLKLPVQFRFAGDAGTTDRKIEIANASVAGIDPSSVLSEGEQTAAALAAGSATLVTVTQAAARAKPCR